CQGTFDIGEFESSAPDPDDHFTFSSDQTCLGPKHVSNDMFYSNPQVDAAEADQLTTADITKRKADFHTIHEAIINDLPVRYLFAPADLYAYKNNIHNYVPAGTGDDWNVQDWYVS